MPDPKAPPPRRDLARERDPAARAAALSRNPRRQSSDDLDRLHAEELAEQRQRELIAENIVLERQRDAERERVRSLEQQMLELKAQVEAVDKKSSLPAPRDPWIVRLLPSVPAVIIAVTGLIVAVRAENKPPPVDPRNRAGYEQLSAAVEQKSRELAALSRDLAKLRQHEEEQAREEAAQLPTKRRDPTAAPTGPNLPPPVPLAPPKPLELPEFDELAPKSAKP